MLSSTETEFRPISALLAQALVAYTVELDNEFERALAATGFAGRGFLFPSGNAISARVSGAVVFYSRSVRRTGMASAAAGAFVRTGWSGLRRWAWRRRRIGLRC